MKKNILIAVSLVILFFGCSKKEEIKPSEDSLMSLEAISVVNVVKAAYQEKNRDVLQNRLDALLAENVLQGLVFEKADLRFTTRVIRIKGPAVTVQMNWQGTWEINGKAIKNRGIAGFVLEGRPMRLKQINGDNPFSSSPVKD